MTEQNVVTVTAEAGRKHDENGELIATIGRCIVFLPQDLGIKLDQRVRVLLDEFGKDRRNRPMYRGVPAAPMRSEKWVADGEFASRVTIITDWLFQEHVDAVLETRTLQTRDGVSSTRIKRKAVLNQTLNESYIEELTVNVIPLEKESVYAGSIIWETVSTREEPCNQNLHLIEKIELAGNAQWDRHSPLYEPATAVTMRIYYSKGQISEETTWENLPFWLQNQHLSHFPLCICGRRRIDDCASDGYNRCDKCRAEEHCSRCAQRQGGMTFRNGRFLCYDCQPYEEAEEWLKQLSTADLEVITLEARKLIKGKALDRETGEMILGATLEHITSDYARNQILHRLVGYDWYYFGHDGVFGTKFCVEALELLQCISHARGNGLIEMLAWIADPPKDHHDYYSLTQLHHEEVRLPLQKVKDAIKRLTQRTVRLADPLRGSERSRITAWEAYQKADNEIPHKGIVGRLLQAAWQVFQEEKQDYTSIPEILQFASTCNDLIRDEYSHCPVCQEEVSWERDHHCPEQEMLNAHSNYSSDVLKVSLCGEVELVKIVVEQFYYGYELRLITNSSVVSTNEVIKTETFWRQPSELEQKLVARILLLMKELEDHLDAVADESCHEGRIQLVFKNLTHPIKGYQLYCSTRRVLYVAYDNYCRQGETWICVPGKRVSVTQAGLPIIAVDLVLKMEEKELKQEISNLEQQLSQERERQASMVESAFDEAGFANTQFAHQFRKLNLI